MMSHKYAVLSFLVIFNVNVCITGQSETLPPGHMQPLGSHRPPDPVEEFYVDNLPTPEEFWRKYVKPSKPVVFRGAAKKSPGTWLWTDEYLLKNYGHLEFRLEAKKEKSIGGYPEGALGIGRDIMSNFLKTYHDSDSVKYIVSELPTPMWHEVMVPPFMSCSPLQDRIVEIDFWFNGGNASSILHKDAFNQLNCLYNGTKEWKLIEYKHEDKIYKRWEPEREVGGYSKINVYAVDMKKYPKVAEVPWQFVTVNAGDCLFLPGSMYHHVKSYGSHNLAVSLLFSRFSEYKEERYEDEDEVPVMDFGKCQNESLKFRPLSEYNVDWQWPGVGMMSMGNPELYNIRHMLYDLLNKKGEISKGRIYRLFKDSYTERSKEVNIKSAKRMYESILNASKSEENAEVQVINAKTIEKLKKEHLRVVAYGWQGYEPSNTYYHEYTLISADDIMRLLRFCMKRGNGEVHRELFLKHYKKNFRGTSLFGNRFFDKLAGKDSRTASRKQIKENLAEALQPYYEWARHHIPDPDNYDVGDVDTMQHEVVMKRMEEIRKEIDDKDLQEFEENEEEHKEENAKDEDDEESISKSKERDEL